MTPVTIVDSVTGRALRRDVVLSCTPRVGDEVVLTIWPNEPFRVTGVRWPERGDPLVYVIKA